MIKHKRYGTRVQKLRFELNEHFDSESKQYILIVPMLNGKIGWVAWCCGSDRTPLQG